ncbi:MAG: zf-HC2 domain-containing protein [Acidobacteriota bacterium]
MMDCRRVEALLDDYVDGCLPEIQAREVEAHLGTCVPCARSEDEIRSLLRRAGYLPIALEPSRDLWPGIEAEIRSPRRESPRRAGSLSLGWLAGAAAALVVLTSAVTLWVTRYPPYPQGGMGRSHPELAFLSASEPDYLRARAALLAALDDRRASLSPETLRVIEENLAAMDTALNSMKAALEKDPGNRSLAALIEATYREEIRLLRRAASLPAHA